jgi:outer membrane protein assembly factor BamB
MAAPSLPQGTLKWMYPLSSASMAPVVGGDGTIYAGGTTALIALGPDGSLRWKCNAILPYFGFLAIGQNGVLIGASGGRVYAVRPNAGVTGWMKQERSLQ